MGGTFPLQMIATHSRFTNWVHNVALPIGKATVRCNHLQMGGATSLYVAHSRNECALQSCVERLWFTERFFSKEMLMDRGWSEATQRTSV